MLHYAKISVALSAKPKVHKLLYCHPRWTTQVGLTCTPYIKFCEVWTCGFWDMRAERHACTDIQTRWSQYFSPSLDEVITSCYINGSERTHRHVLPLVNNVEYIDRGHAFKSAPSGGGYRSPSNSWFLWPQIHSQNGITIGYLVHPFLQGSWLWPTHRYTDRPRCICNNEPHSRACSACDAA